MLGNDPSEYLRVIRVRKKQRADQRAGVEDDALTGEAHAPAR